MMPNKFRKLIWIKRGDYVVVHHSEIDGTNDLDKSVKVKYMIKQILSKDNIRYLKNQGKW